MSFAYLLAQPSQASEIERAVLEGPPRFIRVRRSEVAAHQRLRAIGPSGDQLHVSEGDDRILAPRRELESALVGFERGSKRYQLLFDNLNVGVFVSSLDGRMLDCNQRAVQMAGEPSREALLGSDLVSRYENPADRERMVKALREHGEVRDLVGARRQLTGRRLRHPGIRGQRDARRR